MQSPVRFPLQQSSDVPLHFLAFTVIASGRVARAKGGLISLRRDGLLICHGGMISHRA
jgi:hypothetical protein